MWNKFINGELYVDLNSKEEMMDFLNQCADKELRWASGNKANEGATVRYSSGRMIVVYKECSYSSDGRALFFVASEPLNKKIIKWSDYMKYKNFTKANLESGMIVECRSGERFLVLRDKLLNNRRWRAIENYTSELKENVNYIYRYDIMKVYDTIGVTSLEDVFHDDNLILIWERKEVEEMTLAEVCKLLGKEIKIVK
jgi:hypothetical protein